MWWKYFVCHRQKDSSHSSLVREINKKLHNTFENMRIFKIHNENITAGAFQVSTRPGQSIRDARWRLWHYSYVSSTHLLFFWLDHFSSPTYHHLDYLIVVKILCFLFCSLGCSSDIRKSKWQDEGTSHLCKCHLWRHSLKGNLVIFSSYDRKYGYQSIFVFLCW